MRAAGFIAASVVLVAIAAAFLPSQAPPKRQRSAEFDRQAGISMDAIKRYATASGFTAPIAQLEAERETDALRRLAATGEEITAGFAISSYYLSVRIERIKPSAEHQKELDRAMQKALEVLDQN